MRKFLFVFLGGLFAQFASAQDSAMKLPDLHLAEFHILGYPINGWLLLLLGSFIIAFTLSFSLYMFKQIKKIEVHKSMAGISETIYQTCKTYLKKQGKYLLTLFSLTSAVIVFYLFLTNNGTQSLPVTIALVLSFSLVGMAGSYAVAFYGIRLNTLANSRTAFASLKKAPWEIVEIPLQSGMSIGLFLISLELVMMVVILLFVPREISNYCFLGFAIGESLGASVLRLAGGIFTKIADIGADLMKIVFKVGEDDPRNPAVIADCTGDNAGDTMGPTADSFESYGVTGVALISFIVLAVPDPHLQARLIVWIFAMRFVMDVFSGISYFINKWYSKRKYKGDDFDFEEPLTRLIWIAAGFCISISFVLSYVLIGDLPHYLWAKLAGIISCGTAAALLIPEATKKFTSPKSAHVQEIVVAGREGGPSLVTLQGLVGGAFSAYWEGMLIMGIMFIGYTIGNMPGMELIPHAQTFSLGLVAFGLLCMGPVSIAVDSFGPVSDNAQSIYELSQIEKIEGISEEIEKDFGFTPNFEKSKVYLEKNDGCGNTFKATVKPVLIGTAVSGATIMIFSITLLLQKVGMLNLSLMEPYVLFGLIAGGAFVFWFTGASIQAVVTGAYRATAYVKRHMDLTKTQASVEDSKKVVEICTTYAQKGALNIFIVLFTSTLCFAFFDPNFFIAYLVALAVIGLFQATFMANAGGAWDNAKKIVETEMPEEKGTALHDAVIVGDTIGDPFKDTTSVSLNPIIKFSTLFGLLGIEIAVNMSKVTDGVAHYTWIHWVIAGVLFLITLFFVHKSFYGMRIKQ